MDNRRLVKEATLYSIEGGENETKVVYGDEPDCNDFATELQQDCNDVATTLQHDCNDNATKLQTQNATLQRRFNAFIKKDKTAFIVKNNPGLRKLLLQRNFVKEATGGVNTLYNLNLNIPDTLVKAVNKKGCAITKDRLKEYILCLRIYRRFKISTVIIINVIWVSAFVVMVYFNSIEVTIKEPQKIEVLTAGFNGGSDESEFDLAVREYEAATGKKIYPAGRECLKRAAKGKTKNEIVELIKKNMK
ncbi:MAG: hypothetical protein II956_13360 [Bacteroidales bacterium]|nr:hypothetical protein [Bacteroidales bacterium]